MDSLSQETFKQLLEKKGLFDFEALWEKSLPAVDEGNALKNGGKSDVFRWQLQGLDGEEFTVYVKRQKNYMIKAFQVFDVKSVCAREYENIQIFQNMGFPTVEVLYFREEPAEKRAILITKELKGYCSMEEWLLSHPSAEERYTAITAFGRLLGKLNKKGIYHRCLFARHVFVHKENHEDIKFIDLEKAKRVWCTRRRDLTELGRFYSRYSWLHEEELLIFLNAYLETRQTVPRDPHQWKVWLEEKSNRKNKC